jgi:hypothetical protein
MRLAGAAALLPFLMLAPMPARADIVKLKNGGKLEGAVVNEGKYYVTVELLSGKVTVSRDEIDSIDTDHESPLEVWNGMWPLYRDQKDPEVFCFLASWCRSQGLKSQEKMLRERVASLDPTHDMEHASQKPRADSRTEGAGEGEELKKELPEAGKTELREEKPPAPDKPKKEKKEPSVRITVAPTWVPPMARIQQDGTIVYPRGILAPGPTHLASTDALDIPYWGIAPEGLSMRGNGQDLARAKGEFSSSGLLRAIQTWRVHLRTNDVLLIPPNAGNTRQWRLIYALGPKKAALDAIEQARSGNLQTR